VLKPLPPVASVKVDILDEEHERCVDALNTLAKERSAEALRGVLECYLDHFEHEEILLDEHLYAGVDPEGRGFDADRNVRKTHYQDHERMLNDLKRQLKSGRDVPAEFIAKVTADFSSHADKYDGNYADRLAAALEEKAAIELD